MFGFCFIIHITHNQIKHKELINEMRKIDLMNRKMYGIFKLS